MNRDKIIISITVGLICAILFFVLTVQLRIVKETDITSIQNMREDELKEQLEIWKTRYKETQDKIDEDNKKIIEYQNKIENNEEASELLESELSQMKTTLGKTDVIGEGIIVSLSDDTEKIKSEDLIKLVNELKLAGAEAISINDERIISMTDIVDVNSYILINGQRKNGPFEIKVIGNAQYLISGISAKGGFSDSMKNNGKNISVKEEKNIKIEKYKDEIKLKTIKLD